MPIALPDAAILRDNENQPFVYAATSGNQFGRRPVTLGESLNGQTEVTERGETRRSGHWRRQPFSTVCEFLATLAGSAGWQLHTRGKRSQHRNDPSHRPGSIAAAVRGADDDRFHHGRRRACRSSGCRLTPIPDLSPPQVEIITQWPDHAAEEVERLVSLPLELEMNGVPHMQVMRLDLAVWAFRHHPDI